LSISKDLGLSLVFHAALMAAWALTAIHRAAFAPDPTSSETIWVEFEKTKRPEALRTRQQIVRADRGEEIQNPVQDAFWSDKTRTVTREQVRVGNSGARGAVAPVEAAIPLKNLGVGAFSKLADRPVESSPGAQLSGEYIKGMREGEQTALNTREFVFYGFFERIRGQLDRAWEPILREELIRHYKRGRRLASDQDHVTQVLVTLGARGEVVRVEVQGESGTQLLDETAIRAFNRAGPFPNPPKGLLGTQGTVQIRWEFILKT
jgi:TonB family protein